jgi:hypothetical protein
MPWPWLSSTSIRSRVADELADVRNTAPVIVAFVAVMSPRRVSSPDDVEKSKFGVPDPDG